MTLIAPPAFDVPPMLRTRLTFDHLAIVAPSLEAGVAHVRKRLGVDAPAGGVHPLMGTHNHLMRLGETCFLEIIAIDPGAPAPERPRWFGLDRRGDAPPRLEHWLLATNDLDATLDEAGGLGGEAIRQTRGELSWRIAVRPDGALPMGGAFPGLLEWSTGTHPAAGMADLGCRLSVLTIDHPEAERISRFLEGRLIDARIRVRNAAGPNLSAEIETPSGTRVLG